MNWRNTTTEWGWIVIIVHWLSFVVVTGLFILGLWMVELNYYHSWYHKAPHLHKSIGLLLLILVMFRIIWRLIDHRPDHVSTHSQIEQKSAQIMHWLLYGVILAIMISGYFISTANGRGIDLFDWFEIPAIMPGFDEQEDIFGTIHYWLANCFIFLIIIHAGAALKHHLIDKDRTLTRMLGKP